MTSIVKERMMKEIDQEFDVNPYAFISNFEGLTVSELSEFRQKTGKIANRSFLVKHTFAKKIFKERNFGGAEKFLKGSVLVTFGDRDPQIISKTIIEFAKLNNKLAPAGVLFGNKVYNEAFIKELAKLPSREELLTQVVVRVKSPISGLVMTLGQLARGLVIALNEIKKKKEIQPQTA